MPKRTDLKKIMIVGSGPIVIGQACEFDYSGSQACKALKEEGYEVVLINSNPATIMTDPEMADRTYIEPITPEIAEKIIERERPDALLPTLGGQTGLNLAVELHKRGVLEKYGVELIGANYEAIEKAEDRESFKRAMERIGVETCRSEHISSVEAAIKFAEKVGYPIIVRPSFTLGGTGGGIAYNIEELKEIVENGIDSSPIGQVLVEESVLGWKEIEFEVMRDKKDNVVIICTIENFDPMGIHTGDSITVAPVQTLTDREYQHLRDLSIKIIREIGVETGGSNIQYAVNPDNGRTVIIEVNPRVSRSSALASKATGFPIAKIAAKLAVGYTLDELPNYITLKTPSCYEPTIDYCVVKVPRWDFVKFPGADETLTTQMKSVGEVMSIGRTFKEAIQKAIRSLEQDRYGLGSDGKDIYDIEKIMKDDPAAIDQLKDKIKKKLVTPNAERIFYIRYAIQAGISIDEIFALTKIDRWFLENIADICRMESELKEAGSNGLGAISPELLRKAKRYGFSDRQIAFLSGSSELEVRKYRLSHGIKAVFNLVDTCAAEFEAVTPYFYSTYETEDESRPSDRKSIMILGGGPNRIGQGIEFDYCCVQAVFALRNEGYEVIMVNCNPETVSTDYDISDKLYFEPLTLEDVLNICDTEKPEGVILQFGGQTPLKLALDLEAQGIKILGTSPSSINDAEDRELFAELISRLGLRQPPNGIAMSPDEAVKIADRIGYPVLVRPSYVLGGRAMEIVYDRTALEGYMQRAVEVSHRHPVLIDKFLERATEVDVDAVSDGTETIVAGVMEHIEQAGIHSGDSACSLPPFSLSQECIDSIKRQTKLIAHELKVIGLMNIQFAVKDEEIYILEVNPRASRTVPFVSKATGMSLAQIATRVMLGKSLSSQNLKWIDVQGRVAVKEAVLPFVKFPGVDIILGPEMRSTGEVMGIDKDFGMAFAKSQMAAGVPIPLEGSVLITVNDRDKQSILPLAKELKELGYALLATKGTANFLEQNGVEVERVFKYGEGRPDILDHIKNGKIDLMINTPLGKGPKSDEYHLRRCAITHNVPVITTIQGAMAAVAGIKAMRGRGVEVMSIQEYNESNQRR